MPFFAVGGVEIPIAVGSVSIDHERYGGEQARAENGQLRSTEKGEKLIFKARTIPLTPAQAAPVIAKLKALGPQTCAGDLIAGAGTTTFWLEVNDDSPTLLIDPVTGAVHHMGRVIAFTAKEG